MPKSKTKRGKEDLNGNAGPSKRSRFSSDPKKHKEVSSGGGDVASISDIMNNNEDKMVTMESVVGSISNPCLPHGQEVRPAAKNDQYNVRYYEAHRHAMAPHRSAVHPRSRTASGGMPAEAALAGPSEANEPCGAQAYPRGAFDPVEAFKRCAQFCIQSLKHAFQCRDADCRVRACNKMKIIVRHTATCRRKTSGNCRACKRLVALCCYHGKSCRDAECTVPFCKTIKKKIAALK